jgi:hypothetical protein
MNGVIEMKKRFCNTSFSRLIGVGYSPESLNRATIC